MKFPPIVILCLYLTPSNVLTYAPKTPVIYTKYGPVIGSTEYSRNKRDYMSFRGIPYAKPPIGDLRFKAPEPIEPWEFGLNATKNGPYCIQKNYFFANPQVEGQEDCLYLNIYVPTTTFSTELLPVMVFIHWGGFLAGRGSSDIIGPEYLMDKDVILVTFNYRVGVFGFFSTLDDSAPGNFGLKDQVLALKFVNENIGCFGGDKNRITLFGQSAGGGSVSLHLISPSSRGLFQQAISQSGVALNLWAKPLNAIQPTVIGALATFTGCDQYLGDTKKLVHCLRTVDAIALAETADKFKFFATEPLTPYSIVTETKTVENPNPFLTKEPLEYLQSGNFMKIPYIVGSTEDEGILRVAPFTRQPETLRILNANFASILPQIAAFQVSVGPNTTQIYENVVKFYLNNKHMIDVNSTKSVQGFIDFYSDRAFKYGIFQSAILQSQKGHKPIWMYNFNYRGQYSYGDAFATTSNDINFPWGVSHCDDLLYLFKTPALFPDLQKPTDLAMSVDLLKFWTNFAIYGDPDPNQQIKWKSLNFPNDEIKNANLDVLQITGNYKGTGPKYKVEKGFFPKRMKFWIDQNLSENFPGLM